MAVVVVVDHVGKRVGSGVRSSHQTKCSGICLFIEFGGNFLHPDTVGLSHLFGTDARREGGHIGPQVVIVPVDLIHFVTAYPNRKMLFCQFILPYFTGRLRCKVGHNPVPHCMRTAERIHLLINTRFGRDIGIGP